MVSLEISGSFFKKILFLGIVRWVWVHVAISPLCNCRSLPDLVLEIFTKCLKGQKVLPLKTLCHFVLLYNEDAADLGQKQPWKLSTRSFTGRYLRPHTDSTRHFRYSPAKTAGLSPAAQLLQKKECLAAHKGLSVSCPNHAARATVWSPQITTLSHWARGFSQLQRDRKKIKVKLYVLCMLCSMCYAVMLYVLCMLCSFSPGRNRRVSTSAKKTSNCECQ